MAKPRITVTDGAYVVEGGIPLYLDAIVESKDGKRLEYRRLKEYDVKGDTYLLCRCGRSTIKPFCDYGHMTESPAFDRSEVASREPYERRARIFEGNGLKMGDDGRCAFARLCHFDGMSVWEMSREGDGKLKNEQINAAWHCPTGRLTIADEMSGETYEQEFEPSIIVLEDSDLRCSGPLFVRGAVELVGADGHVYETHGRYALCRCGKTSDTPFCDASHHHEELFENGSLFNDGFFDSDNAEADCIAAHPDESFHRFE